jgi:hypothetical protein
VEGDAPTPPKFPEAIGPPAFMKATLTRRGVEPACSCASRAPDLANSSIDIQNNPYFQI